MECVIGGRGGARRMAELQHSPARLMCQRNRWATETAGSAQLLDQRNCRIHAVLSPRAVVRQPVGSDPPAIRWQRCSSRSLTRDVRVARRHARGRTLDTWASASPRDSRGRCRRRCRAAWQRSLGAVDAVPIARRGSPGASCYRESLGAADPVADAAHGLTSGDHSAPPTSAPSTPAVPTSGGADLQRCRPPAVPASAKSGDGGVISRR